MATLTVKNVPAALVRRRKRQAVLHRRSLNLEVISCARASGKRFEGVDVDAVLKEMKAQRRF